MRIRRGQGPALRRRGVWCWPVLFILALTACLQTSGDQPPVIRHFTADPSSVPSGGKARLVWDVEYIDGGQLFLEGSDKEPLCGPVQPCEETTQSSKEVDVLETTTFRLVATKFGRTTTSETTVSVQGEDGGFPTISVFRATPTSTTEGGAAVTLEWEVQDADRVTVDPPGTEVEESGSLQVDPYVSTIYTLSASNDEGASQETVTVEVDSENRLLFLVAGQSNATGAGLEKGGEFPTDETEQPEEGVLMLTPGLDWVQASEPSHAGFDPDYKHSFLLRFGKEVRSATGKDVFLVPAAVGGSTLSAWEPGDDHFDEAVARARYAANSLGVPVSAIVWYQGESDTKSESRREGFVANTNEVLKGLRGHLAGPDVIFVQLSKRLWSEELHEDGDNVQGHNLAYQDVRESQRLMEAGARQSEVGRAGDSAVAESYYHMVVAHDLPMSDAKHLSAEGQRVLGQRIAHAYLHRVLDPSGQGIGPRLEQISFDSTGNTVLVDLTMSVNSHSSYDDYFAVFVDGSERNDVTIGRDAFDSSVIRLALGSPLPAGAELQVRYMPPESTSLYGWSRNVVKAEVNGLELPLPAFGIPVEEPPEDPIPGLRKPDQ